MSRLIRLGLRCLLVAGVWGLLPAALDADSWPGPVVLNRFSDSGDFFVRIVPGRSIGDTFGFRGAARGPYATGRFYALQSDKSYRLVSETALLNPVAPVDALVTRHGYLVTFDNWHNLGYGKVLAVYNPSGKAVASYELEQLYPPDRLAMIPQSISSRYWRCRPFGFVDPPEQTQLYVRETLGGEFVVTIATGAVAYRPNQIKECVVAGHAEPVTAFKVANAEPWAATDRSMVPSDPSTWRACHRRSTSPVSTDHRKILLPRVLHVQTPRREDHIQDRTGRKRKQVTVLFADLNGSMELLADQDPEEARKVLDPVPELMMEAAHRYQGTVNQVMGDGVVASSESRSRTRITPCGHATPRCGCRTR